MKKITLLKSMLLLCALVVGSGSVWAGSYTTTFSRQNSKLKSTGDVTYTTTVEPGGNGDARGPQWGTSGTPAGEFSLAAQTSITAISKIVVSCCTASKGSATVTVKVGGTKLGSTETITPNTSSADDYEFSGKVLSGIVTIEVNASSKAFYIAGVTITYGIVPVTIPASGYASIVSNYALDFSSAIENLSAPYKATAAASGSGVTLISMSGIVAESTPMILKGTAGETANTPVTTSSATADATGNLLSGSATDAQNIAANEAYILKGGKFCLVTGASSVPAGKAYLLANKVDGGANELTFVIDEENSGTTGIEKTLVNKATDGQIYNLAGQRVAQPTKGLYIVNGKKIVIK